ncbi:hypothetical protein [Oryzisolibacter propanilivorax]|nr:hypothetical protein [Oryzisolibacter propanilivorax]
MLAALAQAFASARAWRFSSASAFVLRKKCACGTNGIHVVNVLEGLEQG